MPWGDLDAEGYTGIELWSFVTDSARARQQHPRAARRSSRRPSRFLDHPPAAQPRRVGPPVRAAPVRRARRRRRASGRHPGRRPRAAAADGLQALVPLPAHAPAGRPSRSRGDVDADRAAVFGALRDGPRVHRRRLARAGARAFASGRRATACWRWATRRRRGRGRLRVQLAAGRAPAPAARRREVASGARRRRSSTGPRRRASTASRPTATRHGRERTWILSNPIYLR